jgi:hypothetical protein
MILADVLNRGEHPMARSFFLILFVVLVSVAWRSGANAAPPTVTPSPGYDARLQEERAQAQGKTMSQPTMTGGGSGSGAVTGRHVKRTHHVTK